VRTLALGVALRIVADLIDVLVEPRLDPWREGRALLGCRLRRSIILAVVIRVALREVFARRGECIR